MEYKFLSDGRKVAIVGQINSTEYIVQEISAVLGDGMRTVERHYLKYTPDYLSNAVNALNIL